MAVGNLGTSSPAPSWHDTGLRPRLKASPLGCPEGKMVVYLTPRDHPDKDVRRALEAICAGSGGWKIIKAGHWASLRCGAGCCMVPVSGTPANPRNHAKFLEREARKHPKPEADPRNRRRSSEQ